MRIYLACVNDSHKPIPLPDGKELSLGRCPETGIQDKKCSRNQALGNNPCQVGSKEFAKGKNVVVDQDTSVYFLAGKHEHVIRFEDMATKRSADSTSPRSKRRKVAEDRDSDSDEGESVQKRLQAMQEQAKKIDSGKVKQLRERKPVNYAVVNEDADDVMDDDTGASEPKSIGDGWRQVDSLLIYTPKDIKHSEKVAGFDIDSTIICTQSGRVFATHIGDWQIMLPEIPGKLKKLQADGYKVVFFTNQLGIQRGKMTVKEFTGKAEKIVAKLGIPIQVVVATGTGLYRKPGLGMWNYFMKSENGGLPVDMKSSFYVGVLVCILDAAGRPKDWAPKRKKDHSLGDRLFAINAGLTFHTPEEYFQNQKPVKFDMPSFNPSKLASTSLVDPPTATVAADEQELVIMVGYPASGKSSFARAQFVAKGYVSVNRDTLKTWQKCVEAAKRELKNGRSVVVDNTNPDVESRKRYVDVAKGAKVRCRCFVMNTTIEHSRHNERFREMTDTSHETIKDMVMYGYRSKFQEPKKTEGIAEIVKVNFIPTFERRDHEILYNQYLLDK